MIHTSNFVCTCFCEHSEQPCQRFPRPQHIGAPVSLVTLTDHILPQGSLEPIVDAGYLRVCWGRGCQEGTGWKMEVGRKPPPISITELYSRAYRLSAYRLSAAFTRIPGIQ